MIWQFSAAPSTWTIDLKSVVSPPLDFTHLHWTSLQGRVTDNLLCCAVLRHQKEIEALIRKHRVELDKLRKQKKRQRSKLAHRLQHQAAPHSVNNSINQSSAQVDKQSQAVDPPSSTRFATEKTSSSSSNTSTTQVSCPDKKSLFLATMATDDALLLPPHLWPLFFGVLPLLTCVTRSRQPARH